MTCYTNCIYCEVCDIADDMEYEDAEIMKSDCPHFKNKADFVEVVRCKSCVHYQNGACNHFGYYTYAPDVDEDDFCSYGERRKQNT